MSSQQLDMADVIERFHSQPEKLSTLNPLLVCLVQGVCDCSCVLNTLHPLPHVLQQIWDYVNTYYKSFIREVRPGVSEDVFLLRFSRKTVKFPPPSVQSSMNINMMPFRANWQFSETGLPEYLIHYWGLVICEVISGRIHPVPSPIPYNTICYLTIHESYVEKGQTQRRGGLHVETPGKVLLQLDESDGKYIYKGRAGDNSHEGDVVEATAGGGKSVVHLLRWGAGTFERRHFEGGVYMCSNVSGSTKVWNCGIHPDRHGNEIIGETGDIEVIRDFLPNGTLMEANDIYWLTDRTPHEALPMKESGYRQYVRIVTSDVSVWFEDHSTPNPNGVLPDPNVTKIIKGSKFQV